MQRSSQTRRTFSHNATLAGVLSIHRGAVSGTGGLSNLTDFQLTPLPVEHARLRMVSERWPGSIALN